MLLLLHRMLKGRSVHAMPLRIYNLHQPQSSLGCLVGLLTGNHANVVAVVQRGLASLYTCDAGVSMQTTLKIIIRWGGGGVREGLSLGGWVCLTEFQDCYPK